jgi:DNA-directed RNA polymerase subunit RPC12/RpoP
MTDAGEAGALSPEEAFGLFGHELRTSILLALWRARDYSLPYAELKDAVDERDSGKFNYHLSKLVGHFVAHEDEEYELEYAGHRVIDAMQSGVFHDHRELDPVELDADCPTCGARLSFEYADHTGKVRCPDCEESVLAYVFDPGGVADRTPEEVVEAFDRRTRNFWTFALSGVCAVCSGDVERTLGTNPATDVVDEADGTAVSGASNADTAAAECATWPVDEDHFAADHPAVVSLSCRQCSFYSYLPVGATLLSHPGVSGRLYDQGVDVRARRLWELGFVVDPAAVELLSGDSGEVALTIRAGRDPLRVVVDDGLTVRSIERRTADRDAL